MIWHFLILAGVPQFIRRKEWTNHENKGSRHENNTIEKWTNMEKTLTIVLQLSVVTNTEKQHNLNGNLWL